MILKAGTYRFNDVLSDYSHLSNQPINFTIPIISNGDTYYANCSQVNFHQHWSEINDEEWIAPKVVTWSNAPNYTVNTSYAMYSHSAGWQKAYFGDMCNVWTITADQEVDDTFGTWYIANTNYNEVNAPKPLATIEYNGQVIASLNAGETCTIKCAENRMISDVVIKINS